MIDKKDYDALPDSLKSLAEAALRMPHNRPSVQIESWQHTELSLIARATGASLEAIVGMALTAFLQEFERQSLNVPEAEAKDEKGR